MHLGCSIGLAVRGCASHPVLDGVGGIPAESSSAKRDRLLRGKTGCSMMGLPRGDEDGQVGSPEQALSHCWAEYWFGGEEPWRERC